MLFTGWKVRIVKNCDRGLENAARGSRLRAAFSSSRSQFFTIRTNPKPVNNLFIFFPSLKRLCFYSRHTLASVTVTMVRDRKIQTALRTNQIAGFVTVTAWKKIIVNITYSDICKSELRQSDRRAAMCIENIFYKNKKVANENPIRIVAHSFEKMLG